MARPVSNVVPLRKKRPARKKWRKGGPRRPHRRIIAFWLVVFSILFAPVIGDLVNGIFTTTEGCRVFSVTDGDTIRAWCPGEGMVSARLVGFDTPELFSPKCRSEWWAAVAAKWHLRLLLWGAGRMKTDPIGKDRYERNLVRLHIDGRDIAEPMIWRGHARRYDGGKRVDWCQGPRS